jgi:hypothetical protein
MTIFKNEDGHKTDIILNRVLIHAVRKEHDRFTASWRNAERVWRATFRHYNGDQNHNMEVTNKFFESWPQLKYLEMIGRT